MPYENARRRRRREVQYAAHAIVRRAMEAHDIDAFVSAIGKGSKAEFG